MEKLNEDTWMISGNVEIDKFEDALGVEISSSEFDTVTGLVFQKLGWIPEDGKQDIDVQIQNLQIHISSVKDHQTESATVKVCEKQEKDTEKV